MVIYNVPTRLISAYRDRDLVIRSSDSSELARAFSGCDPCNIAWLQLLSLKSDCEPLARIEQSVPVDLVLDRGSEDFPLLYNYSKLGVTRPVRVTIPVFQGFDKAVRLTVSLGYSVKLDIRNTDQLEGEELPDILNDYLHSSTVSEPIEFFHSIFVLFYHGQDNNLWAIQEEDPELYRYVKEDGKVVVSRRLAHVAAEGDVVDFLHRVKLELLSERGACATCQFFDVCIGYFRYSNRSFNCRVVKAIFQTLKDAGAELREDIALSQGSSIPGSST